MTIKPTYTIGELSKLLKIPNHKLRFRLRSMKIPMHKMNKCYLIMLVDLQNIPGLVESIELAEQLNQQTKDTNDLFIMMEKI